MHGLDGTRFPNESVFVEVVPPERIVLRHVSRPHFELTITLDERDGKIAVSWQQVFDTAEIP